MQPSFHFGRERRIGLDLGRLFGSLWFFSFLQGLSFRCSGGCFWKPFTRRNADVSGDDGGGAQIHRYDQKRITNAFVNTYQAAFSDGFIRRARTQSHAGMADPALTLPGGGGEDVPLQHWSLITIIVP